MTIFGTVLGQLKQTVQNRPERLRAQQPQTFRLTYTAQVTATATDTAQVSVLLPLPRATAHQQIREEARLLLPTYAAIHVVAGNSYAEWKIPSSSTQTVGYETVLHTTPFLEPNAETGSDTTNQKDSVDTWVCPTEPRILQILEGIHDLRNARTAREKAQVLNTYVVDTLHYGDPIDGLYTVQDALERPRVDCGGFDTLLSSLCQAVGIPTRLVSGFWAGYPKNTMHAWVELYLKNEGWIPADPSVEHLSQKGRTKKIGSFGKIGSDRIILSYGTGFSVMLDGQSMTVGNLQTPIVCNFDAVGIERSVKTEIL